nr:hypothetical protein [Tanacetum cinerariifolium]
TSAEDLCATSFNDTKVKVMKVKHRKPHRGIKVSTPGSAGAGSVIRCLRSAKSSGKARDRSEDSLRDNRGGIWQDGIASYKVGRGFVFGKKENSNGILNPLVGSFFNVSFSNIALGNPFKKSIASNGGTWNIDGGKSFGSSMRSNQFSADVDRFVEKLKQGSKENALKMEYVKVMKVKHRKPHRGIKVSTPGSAGAGTVLRRLHSAKSTGKARDRSEDSPGNTVCGPTSSKGGIAGAKTGIVNDRDMAGSGTLNEHTSMEDVVNTDGVCSSSQDGIASYKVGRGFVFGKKENSNGILNPPVGPFFNGSEEIALKMEYVPSSVCKLENGNHRISFSTKEVYKGGQACSLQLYGYFVGTSMDYRVVRGNLMRMWRIHDIEDITKTNAGVYYFKFKSEEGMKRVLESGPWMIQNVPLVLNERCLKKAGKMDFARVLVEVSADDDLPNVLEIEPRSDEEVAAKTLKDVLNVGKSNVMDKGKSVIDDDGFTVVGKKNKPAVSRFVNQGKVGGHNGWSGRGLNTVKHGYGNSGGGNYGQRRGGGYVQRLQYQQKSNSNVGNMKSGGKFNNNNNKAYVLKEKKKSIVDKPFLAFAFNHNYRPKVLVRGSGSDNVANRPLNEDIPVNNSFNILSKDGDNVEDLGDINVNEEFESKVWPGLKEEVDILLEAGIYPSKQVRLDWSIHQMDYFYKNCHKFHLDPCCEDDEEDVESDDKGIAVDMKPEMDDNAVDNMKINATSNYDVSDGKKNLSRICNRVLGIWEWVSNCSSCDNGTRIIVGWDTNHVNMMVLNQSAQVMHCFIEPINGNPSLFCSFVYACVLTVDRRSLWKSLCIRKNIVKDRPWTILGDFNACLDPAERSIGGSKFTTTMHDLRDCVEEIEVEDIAMTVLNFTWNKKPGEDGGLLKKLDRVLGNSHFMSIFPLSYAHFLPFMLSDHTPAMLVMPKISKAKPKPFKFYNYLTDKDDFIPIVRNGWNSKIDGCSMFSLVSKLKLLKKPLRKLNFEQGNLFENVIRLRADLAAVQSSMSTDPHNKAFREEELKVLTAYKAAFRDEELFLRQKAKVEWLKVGDRNLKYFHNVVKGRCNRNRISYIENVDGVPFHGDNVGIQFVNHFKNVLGQSSNVIPFYDPDRLFVKKLPIFEALNLFFKDSWSVVGDDVCKAVRDFFSNGKLLKEINSTVISLVPKVAALSKSAFIPSRQISDNIMLSQELMRYYHRNRGPAKCAFKIDSEKAYDSVEWVFLSNTLKHFGFPELMVKWIMNCVTSTSFTVNVNGDHVGFFKGMRGLRQGDPLSPYLFTLVMEVFNLVLRREIDMNPSFRFHWQCKELKLTHLCFANDLLLLCNGDSNSVAILKNAISIFGGLSGLLLNFSKSTIFLRLYVKDCSLLIDKARKRLLDWKNKSLSFAGRLQLIKSVLCSLQVYWASVFILPTAIVNDIERLMRDFLWNFGVFKRGKACISWNSVCKPKVEGGLGIKSLDS